MEDWMMWVGGAVCLPYLLMLNHKFGINVFCKLLIDKHVMPIVSYAENINSNIVGVCLATVYLLALLAVCFPYMLTLGVIDKYITRNILINDLE